MLMAVLTHQFLGRRADVQATNNVEQAETLTWPRLVEQVCSFTLWLAEISGRCRSLRRNLFSLCRVAGTAQKENLSIIVHYKIELKLIVSAIHNYCWSKQFILFSRHFEQEGSRRLGFNRYLYKFKALGKAKARQRKQTNLEKNQDEKR